MTLQQAHEQFKALGISTIPVDDNKKPLVEWDESKNSIITYDFSRASGIAVVCGKVSGNMEIIDFDLKYFLSKKMFAEYVDRVNEINPEIIKKVIVTKTKNQGYHFIYRCDTIEGNKKLARRPATPEEVANGDKVKVLIETRGEGGYCLVSPSPGYSLSPNSSQKFSTIQKLTPEERNVLISIATEFDELPKPEYKPQFPKKREAGTTPWEDYNNRGDVVQLLTNHGWTIVSSKGHKVFLKRPGSSTATHSGNWDSNQGLFSVFSTSTEFEPERGYRPSAVFTFLECNKDFSLAGRKLYDLGYGDRIESTEKIIDIPSKIDLADPDDFSFVADPFTFEDYLQDFKINGPRLGLFNGYPMYKEDWCIKTGQLNITNGFDNVGKSTVLWHDAMVSVCLHGWTWVIYSSENKERQVFRKLMEFYWGKQLRYMNNMEYKKARDFVMDHFTFISNKQLYNYKDIINMASKLNSKFKRNGFLIDPYNSLKIDMTPGTKKSVHDYHYDAISEFKLFTNIEESSIFLNVHCNTEASRNRDKEGVALPPGKSDTEGGTKFSAKADDFHTVHRRLGSADWMITERYVRKVKDAESGGKITMNGTPMRFTLVDGVKFVSSEDNHDPIKAWREKETQIPIQQETIEQKEYSTKVTYINTNFDNDEPPF